MAEAVDTGQGRGGVAERYAGALYALASEHGAAGQGALDAVVQDTQTVSRAIGESADLRRVLASPLLDKTVARHALMAVMDAQAIGQTTKNFVGVIVANRRLRDLPVILRVFAAIVAEKRGVVVADVTSAHALTDVQRQQLRARLIEAGYGNVDLRETVDPSLLGGLTVRVGARLYDTSIKSRLQRLNYAMKGAA